MQLHRRPEESATKTEAPVPSPKPAEPEHDGKEGRILSLQRGVGNAAVSRYLTSARAGQATLMRDDDAAAAAAATPVTLKDRFTAAVEKKKVSLSTLRKLIAGQSADERKTVWSDSALMQKAEAKLSKKDYLSLVTDIGMKTAGTVAHKTPEEADKLIREKLAAHVTKAVKAKKQIAGQIAVVSGTDWENAYKYEYGEIDADEPVTNAFVANKLKRRVFIHADRGNPGTVVHEGMHKYSNLKIRDTFGSPMNEGITEYFTRKITDELGIVRSNYEDNWESAKLLVAAVTEDTVAKAYFDGNLSGLKTAFIDYRTGKGRKSSEAKQDWKDFVGAGTDWDTANDLLK